VGRNSEEEVDEASRLFAEEGRSTAQTTDSECTRKRFFYRCRPWEGETATVAAWHSGLQPTGVVCISAWILPTRCMLQSASTI
jgi:hypothetical protein